VDRLGLAAAAGRVMTAGAGRQPPGWPQRRTPRGPTWSPAVDGAVAETPSDEIVVAVEGLRKAYGMATAVDGVPFTVRRGEIVGLPGPNGFVKSGSDSS